MKLLLPLITCVFVCLGCATNKGAQSSQAAVLIDLTSLKVTQQDMYPGALGMVRQIRTYTVAGIADFHRPVTVHRFRVDSLQFPVKKLKINKTLHAGMDVDSSSGTAFSFMATRLFTGDLPHTPSGFGQGARILDGQEFEYSGVMLEGKAQLVLLSGGDTLVVDLGSVEVLPEIYAP